jgi:hypothetical protein
MSLAVLKLEIPQLETSAARDAGVLQVPEVAAY